MQSRIERLSVMTAGLALVATTGFAAGAANNAFTTSGPQTSAIVATDPGNNLAAPVDSDAVPGESVNYGAVGPNGLSIYPTTSNFGADPKSHNQANQLCKIYTSLADFTADHGAALRANCTAPTGMCFEDFQCTPQATAALRACTSGQPMDCTGANLLCTPAPADLVACPGEPSTIVKGVSIREKNPRPQITAGQVGLLNFGPAWFSNPSKFVGNNFFSDALELSFDTVPAACQVAGRPAPRAVGFNPVNYQNHSTALNYVTVSLAGGAKFVYTTLADNSQRYYTGVCCSADILKIELAHNGAFGEGVDNLAFGAGNTCTPPKVEATPNQILDALEALKCDVDLTPIETKLDKLEIKLDPPVSQ